MRSSKSRFESCKGGQTRAREQRVAREFNAGVKIWRATSNVEGGRGIQYDGRGWSGRPFPPQYAEHRMSVFRRRASGQLVGAGVAEVVAARIDRPFRDRSVANLEHDGAGQRRDFVHAFTMDDERVSGPELA